MSTIILYTGTTTWDCPKNVTGVTVECWGGGGAGAGATTSMYTGGGGGGAYSKGYVLVSSGTTYTITVGEARSGTTGEAADGNASWFSSVTTVYAEGGKSGKQSSAGAGGSLTNGYGNIAKYSGGNGYYSGSGLAGGGGGAGSGGDGGSSTSSSGGSGTSEYGGNGGNGVSNPASGAAAAGTIYGGGGGGIRRTNGNRIGGNGTQGLVRITYDSSGSQVKYYTGSIWTSKPLKRYNGVSWVPAILKRYDGAGWTIV